MFSLLLLFCPYIYLTPIEDPVGFGREWFRLERLGPDNDQVPAFVVYPIGTYFEQWQDDTDGDGKPELGPGNLVWFSGPSGKYEVKASLPCGSEANIYWTIKNP